MELVDEVAETRMRAANEWAKACVDFILVLDDDDDDSKLEEALDALDDETVSGLLFFFSAVSENLHDTLNQRLRA